jgi:hypothetical protein
MIVDAPIEDPAIPAEIKETERFQRAQFGLWKASLARLQTPKGFALDGVAWVEPGTEITTIVRQTCVCGIPAHRSGIVGVPPEKVSERTLADGRVQVVWRLVPGSIVLHWDLDMRWKSVNLQAVACDLAR